MNAVTSLAPQQIGGLWLRLSDGKFVEDSVFTPAIWARAAVVLKDAQPKILRWERETTRKEAKTENESVEEEIPFGHHDFRFSLCWIVRPWICWLPIGVRDFFLPTTFRMSNLWSKFLRIDGGPEIHWVFNVSMHKNLCIVCMEKHHPMMSLVRPSQWPSDRSVCMCRHPMVKIGEIPGHKEHDLRWRNFTTLSKVVQLRTQILYVHIHSKPIYGK